jgi:hypothetical protein
MTTALQIVDGAAEELTVKTAEIPLESEDAQIFFDRMNDMLSEWADIGITKQFSEVFNLSDTVQIDRNAVAAVKYNLAIRCAPAFQKQVAMALGTVAQDSYNRLLASITHIDVEFPDTLPVGSGNQCNEATYLDDRFFPHQEEGNF